MLLVWSDDSTIRLAAEFDAEGESNERVAHGIEV
jgi:hypothetical protein